MIPKTIHWCWLGRNPKPKLVRHCRKSWDVNLSGFTIQEWNEDNIDLGSNTFLREAYDNKKWAFASDYVRLWALANLGGIYLDADVEVLRPLDDLLNHRAFTGFENYRGGLAPITAVMGSEPNHPWIIDLLNIYRDKRLVQATGEYDLTPNTVDITRIMSEKYAANLLDDNHQVLREGLHLYPSTSFCVKSPNSYSVHHFAHSWIPFWKRTRLRLQLLKERILGLR